MTTDPRLDRIRHLNQQYQALTGSDAYLYTSAPGDGQTRVVFTDGVQQGYGRGVAHMTELLAQAQRAADDKTRQSSVEGPCDEV